MSLASGGIGRAPSVSKVRQPVTTGGYATKFVIGKLNGRNQYPRQPVSISCSCLFSEVVQDNRKGHSRKIKESGGTSKIHLWAYAWIPGTTA